MLRGTAPGLSQPNSFEFYLILNISETYLYLNLFFFFFGGGGGCCCCWFLDVARHQSVFLNVEQAWTDMLGSGKSGQGS